MNNTIALTIEEMHSLINGTKSLIINVGSTKKETRAWMSRTLVDSRYALISKKDRGTVRAFIKVCTNYSFRHMDRCIMEYKQTGQTSLCEKRESSTEFVTFYTTKDIALLAKYTEAMQHQNGKAICSGLKDMYHLYEDVRFERLAHLSPAHFYNLKKTQVYKNEVLTYTKTKSTPVNIGERKKPYPQGKLGYLRVDSVHQGDRDKEKGVYHIHFVDEVTQWDVILAAEGLSEVFLIPVLEKALALFPFAIINFHSDNGSEYINQRVAALLEKLRVAQTKSRPRQSGDQALVEGKNAATVRPFFGRTHIPQCHAKAINEFNEEYFIPFLNYHRKCAFPTEIVLPNGKIKKEYKIYLTPCEKLLSLPDVVEYLRQNVTVPSLQAKAEEKSHHKAASEMQEARTKLFKSF